MPQKSFAHNPPEFMLFAGAEQVHSGKLARPLQLGRECDDDSGPLFSLQNFAEHNRIAIARKEFADMSRRLLLVTPLGPERIRVRNLSGNNSVNVDLAEPIWPGQERDFDLPVAMTVFDRRMEYFPAARPDSIPFASLDQPVAAPGSESIDLSVNRPQLSTGEGQDAQIIEWLAAVARVLQSAIGSDNFYERAAVEMVHLVGLDAGWVLEREPNERWRVATHHDADRNAPRRDSWRPISNLLDEVVRTRRTVWVAPDQSELLTSSMEGVSIAVASPLLDTEGKVVGALYGERRLKADLMAPPEITPLDAVLVETLARGVAAGRARVKHEREAGEARVRFEQFFTPELSKHLTESPDLLMGKDAEVTMLFCDIRLFSRIGEKMGPAQTMEWLRDVMGSMADKAANHQGVLVDFIGDELMIMWGAPSDQPDHATLACRAALDMSAAVGELDKRWRPVISEKTALGFGLNTGVARVGNVGFERKFRYAPLGNAVNLASRVQGATKYLGVDVVATESTFKQAKVECLSRRLCSVRVVNIEQPVNLYQLSTEDAPAAKQLCQQYEEALKKFEVQDFTGAAHILSDLLKMNATDRPSLLLLSRAVEQLVGGGTENFTGVFELPGK